MTIHRFFIDPQFINEESGTILCQSQNLVKQIRKVLRLENGDQLDVLDGQGNIYHCVLANIIPQASRDFFQAKIADKERIIDSVDITFTVALPLIKQNRFEWALEKLTELGVNKIVPIALARTAIKTADLPKLIRWRKIIEEAAEQSERSRLPELANSLEFLDWLRQSEPVQNNSLRLICAERGISQTLEMVLYNFKNKQINYPINCAIAVGAEGGFTEEEMQAALAQNFVPVTLGHHILRSETAAIFALRHKQIISPVGVDAIDP